MLILCIVLGIISVMAGDKISNQYKEIARLKNDLKEKESELESKVKYYKTIVNRDEEYMNKFREFVESFESKRAVEEYTKKIRVFKIRGWRQRGIFTNYEKEYI